MHKKIAPTHILFLQEKACHYSFNPLSMNTPSSRLAQIDFVKCIMILLMVAFHLSFFSTHYPTIKQFVYTFHMPAFLLISGWFLNVNKPIEQFQHTLLKLFIPYLLMESGYIVASSWLNIEPSLTPLTPFLFVKTLFISPVGPYWFLQTLLLCALTHYFCHQHIRPRPLFSMLLQLAMVFLWAKMGLLSFACASYFVFGTYLKQKNIALTSFFKPRFFYVIPLVWLCSNPTFFHKETWQGALLVYFVISFCLFLYGLLPTFCKKVTSYIGQNTLAIFLFSPLFTLMAKRFIPFFSFDSSRLLFALFATSLAVCGSLALQKILLWFSMHFKINKF